MKKLIVGKANHIMVGKHKITNKALLIGIGLFIVVVAITYIISNMYFNETTFKHVTESTFGYKAKEFIDGRTNFVSISVYADSKEDGLSKLKTTYHKLSGKCITDDVKDIVVVVYDHNGNELFTSMITADIITSTDWNKSYSYDEFMTLANVQ